jgi:hypothetical protein
VERAYHARDGVYWVPPADGRRALRPGMRALLLFAWADPAPDDPGRERLWVEVERAEPGGAIFARLASEPLADAPLSEGARVVLGPEHVLDLADARGAASLAERSDLVRCRGHGWSEPCFVCEHVTHGEGLGFHVAAGCAALRPHAWCDACDVLLLAAGGSWELVEEDPPVSLVCGGCYDRYRDLNRRAGE